MTIMCKRTFHSLLFCISPDLPYLCNIKMLDIKRLLVWLGRIHRCRGFGVQSPWAYAMVRYVINEHWPYYAYEPLRRAYPQVGGVGRKLLELCLRLANRVQPAAAFTLGVDGEMYVAYIKAGCRRAAFFAYDDAEGLKELMKRLVSGDGSFLSPVPQPEPAGTTTHTWAELFDRLLR